MQKGEQRGFGLGEHTAGSPECHGWGPGAVPAQRGEKGLPLRTPLPPPAPHCPLLLEGGRGRWVPPAASGSLPVTSSLT